jgi:nitrite reductase (NADH) large subunit
MKFGRNNINPRVIRVLEFDSMKAADDAANIVGDEKMNLVIVGGGIAGVTAAAAARDVSPEVKIVMIHDEPGLPYNRLNLTLMIAGEVSPDELEYKASAWYDEKRIEHIHDSVTGIDRASKTITLKEKGKMNYGALVLATGASPFIPPIPGVEKTGVTTLRTLAQAKEILSNVRDGTRCVCIGGGLLGIELAVGLSKQGGKVTILEGADWLLSRQLAPRASAILKSRIEVLGLKILCGAKVTGIIGNGKVSGVSLATGEKIEAEMVLISAGVRPNMRLAMDCGLETEKGVKVDDRMATSDPAIFAAGDVTEHKGVVYGLWPAAMEQGKVAGANAAGGAKTFEGIPASAFLKVVGVDVFSTGDFMPKDEKARIIEKENNSNYVRLAIRDGILIGANLVGDTTAALPIKSAVSKATPVSGNERLLKLFPELASFPE